MLKKQHLPASAFVIRVLLVVLLQRYNVFQFIMKFPSGLRTFLPSRPPPKRWCRFQNSGMWWIKCESDVSHVFLCNSWISSFLDSCCGPRGRLSVGSSNPEELYPRALTFFFFNSILLITSHIVLEGTGPVGSGDKMWKQWSWTLVMRLCHGSGLPGAHPMFYKILSDRFQEASTLCEARRSEAGDAAQSLTAAPNSNKRNEWVTVPRQQKSAFSVSCVCSAPSIPSLGKY